MTLLLEPWPDLYRNAMARRGQGWINLLQAAAALLASGSGADLIPIWWHSRSHSVGSQHTLDRHVRHLDPMTLTDGISGAR